MASSHANGCVAPSDCATAFAAAGPVVTSPPATTSTGSPSPRPPLAVRSVRVAWSHTSSAKTRLAARTCGSARPP